MRTHVASLGMQFAKKDSIHISDRKAGGFGPTGHLAGNTLHFSSTPVITPDYKFHIIMSCLTLNIQAAKWYQFKLLIKAFGEHFSLCGVPLQRYFEEDFLKYKKVIIEPLGPNHHFPVIRQNDQHKGKEERHPLYVFWDF